MLSWLWPFRNKARRDIFTFFDGTATKRADPLVVLARIEKTCPDYAELMGAVTKKTETLPPGPVLEQERAVQKAATEKLIETVRAAFGLKPLDDTGGLTEVETMRVFNQFLLFMGGLADRARPLPD